MIQNANDDLEVDFIDDNQVDFVVADEKRSISIKFVSDDRVEKINDYSTDDEFEN